MAKKRIERMPPEFRAEIQAARERGEMVFFTKAGDVGFTKMKRGGGGGRRKRSRG